MSHLLYTIDGGTTSSNTAKLLLLLMSSNRMKNSSSNGRVGAVVRDVAAIAIAIACVHKA
jgi:hypothetical protein